MIGAASPGFLPDDPAPETWPRPLPGELPRAVLVARLLQAEEGLILLVAGSGFGKTTLLAQYARSVREQLPRRRVAWHRVRADDAMPRTLARSVLRALSPILGDAERRGLEDALQTEPPLSLAARLAEALNAAPTHVSLILDSAEQLGPDAQSWLTALLDALGEGHQLLLAAYDASNPDLARRRARGRALVLGPADLAFNEGEVRALLAAGASTLDPAETCISLEGWPIGVALLAASGHAPPGPSDLLRNLVGRLPPTVQNTLAELSVLEEWSAEAAAELGLTWSESVIRAAKGGGLPLTPLGADRWRPHRLLTRELGTVLRQNGPQHSALHTRAARAAEQRGNVLEAARHYQQAGQWAEAARLARALVPILEERAEHHLVRDLLGPCFLAGTLPPELQRAHAAALIETGEPARGEALLLAVAQRGDDARALALLARQAVRQGRRNQADALSARAQAVARDGRERAEVGQARASVLWDLGRHDEARGVAAEVTRWAEQAGDGGALAVGLSLLGLGHTAAGRYVEAQPLFARAVALFDSIGAPRRATVQRNNLATILMLRGEWSEARKHLRQALQHAEEVRSKHLPVLYGTLGDVLLLSDAPAEALAAYTRSHEVAQDVGAPQVQVGLAWVRSVEAARRAGDPSAAALALDRARLAAGEDAALGAELAFQEALIAFDDARPREAQRLFTAALNADVDAAVRARLYLAELARRAGGLTPDDLAVLIEQLDHIGADGLLRPDAPRLRGLYAEAARRGWWPERFAPLLAAAPPAITTTLELRTLGLLELSVGDRGVRLPFAKCGELLVWLALYGPASRERIVDALWNGSDSPSHAEYFKVVVRRTRAALIAGGTLEFNPLPYEAGVYGLSPLLEVRADLTELGRAAVTGEPATLRRALERYRGDFLSGAQGEWIETLRRRALDDALTVALMLGASLESSAPREALAAYRRATELDPLAESAHQGVVRVLSAQGNEASAQVARRAFQRVMEEAGIDPSPLP